LTLILTVASKHFVLQVSDRRLTAVYSDQRSAIASDDTNKAAILRGPRLNAVLGFTGLAKVAGLPTADWLLEAVGTESVESGFDSSVDNLRRRAEEAMLSKDLVGPLAIHVAGYSNGSQIPRFCEIANVTDRRFKAVSSGFVIDDRSSDLLVEAAGCTGALHVQAISGLMTLVRKQRSYPTATDAAVAEIRRASRHGKLGKYVGSNCMSICLWPDGGVDCVYHPERAGPQTFAPNLIEPFVSEGRGAMMFKDAMMEGDGRSYVTLGTSGVPIRNRWNLTKSSMSTKARP
jgi:hypothetical protein